MNGRSRVGELESNHRAAGVSPKETWGEIREIKSDKSDSFSGEIVEC